MQEGDESGPLDLKRDTTGQPISNGARGDVREPFVQSCILPRLRVSSLKPIIWHFRTKPRSPSSSIAASSSDSPSKISNRSAHLGNTFDGKECVLDVAFRRAPIQSPIPGGKHGLLGARR